MKRNCPICGFSEATPVPEYSRDHWIIVSCDQCSLVYLANPPGYAALEETFAWEKTYEAEARARLTSRPIARRIHLATRWRHSIFGRSRRALYVDWFGSGNLLNVGCAAATDSFPEFRAFGIELSKELAIQANRNLEPKGGRCVHGPGATAIWDFDSEMFDGIVMRSYLEHEEHPLKALQGARRAIKETGRVYVRVPNYGSINRKVHGKSWCGFRYPDHVNYFTHETLSDMADRSGFSLHLLHPLRMPVDDNINALLAPC